MNRLLLEALKNKYQLIFNRAARTIKSLSRFSIAILPHPISSQFQQSQLLIYDSTSHIKPALIFINIQNFLLKSPFFHAMITSLIYFYFSSVENKSKGVGRQWIILSTKIKC